MSRKDQPPLEHSKVRERALSRWENQGATPAGRAGGAPGESAGAVPELSNAELVQLQIRVIALENVVLALLARVPPAQLELVREMATYISPRPGYTPHRLTIHAAAQMVHLVERAGRFADGPALGGATD